MSFATHFSLSKLTVGAATSVGPLREGVDDKVVFGAPKNDVILALALGFFASAAARSAALRLRLEAIVVLRKIMNEDTVTNCRKLWNLGFYVQIRIVDAFLRVPLIGTVLYPAQQSPGAAGGGFLCLPCEGASSKLWKTLCSTIYLCEENHLYSSNQVDSEVQTGSY